MTDPLPSIMYRCSRAIVRAVYTLGGPRKAFSRVDLEFGPFAPVELCKTPHAHGNVPWQEPPCAKLIVQHFKTQNFYVLPVNLPKMRGFAAHADWGLRAHACAERYRSLFRSESVRHLRMSTCTQYGVHVLGAGSDNIIIIN